MLIKGKDRFNLMMIYQGKTATVRKTQSSVIKLAKDRLCLLLNVLCNAQNYDGTGIELVHERDCGAVAAAVFEERIDFIQHVVGGVQKGTFLLDRLINGFGDVVMLIFRNGEGTEGAGVDENLQSATSP